jgi:hypothetical protein
MRLWLPSMIGHCRVARDPVPRSGALPGALGQLSWRRNPQMEQTAAWPSGSSSRKLGHPLVPQKSRFAAVGRRRRRRMDAARPMVEV